MSICGHCGNFPSAGRGWYSNLCNSCADAIPCGTGAKPFDSTKESKFGAFDDRVDALRGR